MKKILIIKKIHDSGIKLLDSRKDFSYEITENLETSFLINKVKDCDAISLKTSKLGVDLINAANKLKIISRHGVGYDNVDLEAVKKKKIILSITTNSNATSVAEHVFFMMLSISRGADTYDKTVKEGKFLNRKNLELSKELWNKNILIAGFGRVGRNLIKKCTCFDMNVFVYDPYVDEKIIANLGGKKIADFKKTIREMDYVSLHIPLTKETKNFIDLIAFKNQPTRNQNIQSGLKPSEIQYLSARGYFYGQRKSLFCSSSTSTCDSSMAHLVRN